MKRILVVGCSMVLGLIVMDTHFVKTSSGLTVRGTAALAADLPPAFLRITWNEPSATALRTVEWLSLCLYCGSVRRYVPQIDRPILRNASTVLMPS